MSRQQLQLEKEKLLRQIEQQRLDLANSAAHWLEITAPYDRGWLKILEMRKILVLGSSVLAIYSTRHPSRVIRWSRRALSVWGTVRLFRRTFSSR
ncbi:YqjK-like family protein [Yersinia ruckeri]|uniref:YqjK-like family protein n=1 Tax=Yersinia ruckeri TaxID=29486 RepID=UPI0011AAC9B8|nr:YqjK-like family protein [Yersinia ruckeri]EKN3346009.1 YqjK-like family protein [Yersinia ruckeri]EKN3363267.1 YqjK-like family protein [Yersinia ruckeri]EKN4203002.1 YqjK-like family protein [Yersinia ruckeri]EKN4207913.1 YqjK-like family protein [Yersinia ruckeri]EKN4698774.1 YqjK-like family protein [Yersinia ruckeri]